MALKWAVDAHRSAIVQVFIDLGLITIPERVDFVLIHAIRSDNPQEALEWIRQGPTPGGVDLALMAAVERGQATTVASLVALNPSLKFLHRAVIAASEIDRIDIISLLAAISDALPSTILDQAWLSAIRGGSLTTLRHWMREAPLRDRNFMTSTFSAGAALGNMAIMEALMDYTVKPFKIVDAVCRVIAAGNFDLLRRLLGFKIKPGMRGMVLAIRTAIRDRKPVILEYLLTCGLVRRSVRADILQQEFIGVYVRGDLDILDVVLRQGLVPKNLQVRAWQHARETGNVDMTRLLAVYGVETIVISHD
jgi:hypothetical protein